MIKSEKCIIHIPDESREILEVSNSKGKTHQRCPYKYFLKYIEKLRPIKKSRNLFVGTWIHSLLEAHDLGEDMKVKMAQLIEENWAPLFIEEKQEFGDVPEDTRRIIRRYFRKYGENDKRYTPVMVEQDFMIQVPHSPIVLTGKIDKITTDERDRYWIWEHKTAKKIPVDETQRMIESQTGLYSYIVEWFMKLGILPRKPIAGVLFDYIRSSPPSPPFELKSGGLSKAKNKTSCDYHEYLAKIKELGLNVNDYKSTLSEIKAKDVEFLNRVAITKSDRTVYNTVRNFVYSSQEIWNRMHQENAFYPKHVDWTCTGGSKCDYLDACVLDLQGYDYKDLIGTIYERSKMDAKEERNERD
jgi:RecB family exonuclease